jgi:hypothetical protein
MNKLFKVLRYFSIQQLLSILVIILYSIIYLWLSHNAINKSKKDLLRYNDGIMGVILADIN